MTRTAYTPEERQQLRERGRQLYDSGQSIADVATTLRVSPSTMRVILTEGGTAFRSPGGKPAPKPSIAVLELREQWRRRYEAGETVEEIHRDAPGRSFYFVHQQLVRSGVQMRTPGRRRQAQRP